MTTEYEHGIHSRTVAIEQREQAATPGPGKPNDEPEPPHHKPLPLVTSPPFAPWPGEIIAKHGCCNGCGRSAGSNGYCGPSGCYDVPG